MSTVFNTDSEKFQDSRKTYERAGIQRDYTQKEKKEEPKKEEGAEGADEENLDIGDDDEEEGDDDSIGAVLSGARLFRIELQPEYGSKLFRHCTFSCEMCSKRSLCLSIQVYHMSSMAIENLKCH